MCVFTWLLEKNDSKKFWTKYIHNIVYREREQPPRFAQPGSFEYEYAMRWKALIEMEKQQQDQVDRNIKEAREKLEMEMEAARHEHQVMLMRQGEYRPVGCKTTINIKCHFLFSNFFVLR